MLEKNFSNRLKVLEKLFNLYQKQHLSKIGKITVIKSLAIPKLVYPLSVLPKPPHKVLDQIETMFRRFIWQSSRSRILVTELQKDTSEGGLRLTNLGFLNKAIKLSWIKRMLCENNDFKYILMNLTGLEVKNLWELNCDSLHHISLNLRNNFWSEVIFSWKNYKELFINKIDPRTYPLWGTSFLTNENIVKRKTEFQESGRNYLNDLIDCTGAPMGYLSFNRKYGLKVNFVDFFSLIHSIPRIWKVKMSKSGNRLNHDNMNQKALTDVLKMPKICKGTYWTFINSMVTKRNIEQK